VHGGRLGSWAIVSHNYPMRRSQPLRAGGTERLPLAHRTNPLKCGCNPRKKATRWPTLEHVAADPQTRWHRVTVKPWYGEVDRAVEITTDTAVWYDPGKPPVAIRWVLVRDLPQWFDTQTVLCTDPDATAIDSVLWFVRR
jgi:hypothetical protein